MKVDRQFFRKACEALQKDEALKEAVESQQWEEAVRIIREEYEDKPELYLNLEKIRRNENLDRRLTWREVLERVFGLIPTFKTKKEKMEEECDKFIAIHRPESKDILPIKSFLKCYLEDEKFRSIINKKEFGQLHLYTDFSMREFQALNSWKDIILGYVKDYIPLSSYL